MNQIPAWINYLSAFATAVAALATAVAAWHTRKASRVAEETLRQAVKMQNDTIRPLIDVRRNAPPWGNGSVGGTYSFEFKNVGAGPAVLGTDPLWSMSSEQYVEARKNNKPVVDVRVLENHLFPNTLAQQESCSIQINAGYYAGVPMPDPYAFDFHYTDAVSRHYVTTVSFKPTTGDVVGISTLFPN